MQKKKKNGRWDRIEKKAANKCPAHMASPSVLLKKKKYPRWILHYFVERLPRVCEAGI